MFTRGPLHHNQPNPGDGFSLLEVLIALVILSVGLLGIAAMISTTLKANDSAYMRSQATDLAYNIIDRMRANRAAAITGGYPSLALGLPGVATDAAALSACNTGGAGVPCDAAAMAAYDLSNWKAELATILPSGTGSITVAPPAGTGAFPITAVTVTVQWSDVRAQQGLGVPTTPYSLDISTSL